MRVLCYSFKDYQDLSCGESEKFGFELEINFRRYEGSKHDFVLFFLNRYYDYLVAKSDASIPYGFEIVSHILPVSILKDENSWLNVLSEDIKYFAKNKIIKFTTNTGLHIHINKSCFGKDEEEQASTIANLIVFIELNKDFFKKISKRTEKSFSRWCDFFYTENTEYLKEIIKTKRCYRYHAVNFSNDKTAELRFFKADELFLEKIKFSFALIDAVKEGFDYDKFVENLKSYGIYNTFKKYLKEINLN